MFNSENTLNGVCQITDCHFALGIAHQSACRRRALICVVTLGLDPRPVGFLRCFSTAIDDIVPSEDLVCIVNDEMDIVSGHDVLVFLVEVREIGFEFTQQATANLSSRDKSPVDLPQRRDNTQSVTGI